MHLVVDKLGRSEHLTGLSRSFCTKRVEESLQAKYRTLAHNFMMPATQKSLEVPGDSCLPVSTQMRPPMPLARIPSQT